MAKRQGKIEINSYYTFENHYKIKTYCFLNDVSMCKFIESLVNEYIEKNLNHIQLPENKSKSVDLEFF